MEKDKQISKNTASGKVLNKSPSVPRVPLSRFAAQAGSMSPSDKIMSPCTKKISNLHWKHQQTHNKKPSVLHTKKPGSIRPADSKRRWVSTTADSAELGSSDSENSQQTQDKTGKEQENSISVSNSPSKLTDKADIKAKSLKNHSIEDDQESNVFL